MGKDQLLGDLESFFARHKSFSFKKGEIVLRAGDIPQGVYCIKKGYIRLYALSEEGKELTFIIYKAGDFFPVVWTLKEEPSRYYFQALTFTETKRVPRAEFLDLILKNPEVFFRLTQDMATRFQASLRRMEYLVFGKVQQRLASLLWGLARQFGKKERKNTIIQVPLTHTDLASLLGVTRETISLEMKKLERERIVAYKKRLIRIKSLTKLHKEANLP
ncbi:MAG: Crp/Fnr family transcriptional regulator [Candidatus Levybacteria bacterium]|nr:Crp/Fnr family transcriptional regulator [Candidatus Levybacteria bacterium]MBI2622816.1 Crp/Fnr family transcriptional regulator [Candidatus Levybacteria bacterium]